MDKDFFNIALYRPIKEGEYYDKLLPKSVCEATFLGNGNTALTVDLIKETIVKHQNQTKKLAPKLKKSTLKSTVLEIYNFLYNHIQYKVDNIDQNLRSPACSWHSRKIGIDCKSFSIFSGCLLSNLGIKYYIRKIKQPGLAPKQYTHVYIVVPSNQESGSLKDGYHLLDATTHNNSEAIFLEKKDTFMDLPHIGLNAPLQGGNPNSFEGIYENVPQNVLEAFDQVIYFLSKVGVSQQTLSEAKKHLYYYVQKGINPQYQLNKAGLVIGRKLFPFTFPQGKTNPYKVLFQNVNLEELGLNGGEIDDDFPEDDNQQTTEEIGVDIEEISNTITNSGWWDNTIAAVLGNGWDLSCWGSSSNPKKAKGEVAIDAPAFFEASGLAQNVTTESLRKFIRPVWIYIKLREYAKDRKNRAKCTRDGDKAGWAAMKAYYHKIILELGILLSQNGGSLVYSGDLPIPNFPEIPTPSGYLHGRLRDNAYPILIKLPVYKVNAPIPIAFPNPPQSGDMPQSPPPNTPPPPKPPPKPPKPQNNVGQNPKPTTKPKPRPYSRPIQRTTPVKKAGINPIIPLLLIGSAIMYKKKKGNKKTKTIQKPKKS